MKQGKKLVEQLFITIDTGLKNLKFVQNDSA